MTFSASLLVALAGPDRSMWMQHVHVIKGIAHATNGHRMHTEQRKLRDGEYYGDRRVGKPEAHKFRCCLKECGVPPRLLQLGDILAKLERLKLEDSEGRKLAVPLGAGGLHMVGVNTFSEPVRCPRPKWWPPLTGSGPYVNARYLIEALRHTGATTVHVGGPLDPVLLVAKTRRAIVMPVRVP